jgi:hypothetical protein
MVGMPLAAEAVNEIRLRPCPAGLRAVFLVETHGKQEMREVEELFRELRAHVQVRQLSQGRLMSYAVQASESDTHIIDAIEDVLRDSFDFVIARRTFEPGILRTIRDLCRKTKSRSLAVPKCNICGKPEPFPRTVVSLHNNESKAPVDRGYCARCSAEAEAPTNKSFIRVLLAADEQDFGVQDAELERRRSGKEEISFRIR